MHSTLRDRYSRRALILDLLILSGSVLLCATALVDPQYLRVTRLTADGFRLALSSLSILIFILSLISLRADWKGVAGRHQQACTSLYGLKARCREITTTDDPSELRDFRRVYNMVMNELVPIPDRLFPRLKAYHVRKVALSKLVDSHPGAPLLALRLLLFTRTSLGVLQNTSDE